MASKPMLMPNMGFKLTDIYFQLFCEKLSDGTKHLRLKGKELFYRMGKRLTHMDMPAVCLFLRNHPDVISIDLSYNDIGDIGLEIMSENYFDQKNSMLHLNLMSNDLTYIGLSALFKVADNLNLKSLRLNGNKFGRRGGEYVAKFIECIPTLEFVEVGDTDQIKTSIDSIFEMAKNSNLKVLDVSRVIPKTEYDIINPSWVAQNAGLFLERNKNLVEIHMEKCEMDGHDVEKMMLGLVYNKTLKLLNIGANKIGCYGLRALARWLMTNPSLLGLDVSNNLIGDTGARALGFGMCHSKLKFLNISYNRIGDEGMSFIFGTLKKPFQMRLLYIFGNQFGRKSLMNLKRMLLSGVLQQNFIDTKLYEVDNEIYAAYYPVNHFKNQYYAIMAFGYPEFLKIKHHKVEPEDEKRRPFYHLPWYERYRTLYD